MTSSCCQLPPSGDLAAFGVKHFDAVADLGPDAFQHGDVVFRHAAVTAEQRAMRVRPDDRDGLQLRRIERGKVVFVLQQRDGLAGGLERQLAMRIAAHDAVGLVRVHVGIVEEAHLEFPVQHRRDEFIKLLLLEHALADEFDEVQVAIRLGQLDVHARLDGQAAGLLLVRGDVVPVCVRAETQFPDRVVIRHDEALEAPFLPQHIAQKPLAGVRRNAVNLVVAGHHADGPGLAEHVAERMQERLAEHALGDVDRRAVLTGLRLAVRGEVLERGHDAALVLERGVALEAAHRCDAQARVQVRILAVSLLDSAPARVARHVHDRRERLMRPAHTRFVSRHGEKLLDQRRVERGAQADGLAEARGVARRVAVETFLVEDHRDAEAGVFEEELLDGVGQLRHLPGRATHPRLSRRRTGVARPAHLADTVPLLERGFRLGEVEVTLGVQELFLLLLPDADHLRGLLFEGHARE
jgi:hypothetical protein